MDAATKVTEPERDFGGALAQASMLVVDDEAGMRHFLARTLSSRCKAVAVAEDCVAAMALMEARHFDLLIVDNLMQGKRGVDWLAEQRAKGLLPPAILITAFADLETAIQALKAGASDFLLKPFRSNQILNAVARTRRYRAWPVDLPHADRPPGR